MLKNSVRKTSGNPSIHKKLFITVIIANIKKLGSEGSPRIHQKKKKKKKENRGIAKKVETHVIPLLLIIEVLEVGVGGSTDRFKFVGSVIPQSK